MGLGRALVFIVLVFAAGWVLGTGAVPGTLSDGVVSQLPAESDAPATAAPTVTESEPQRTSAGADTATPTATDDGPTVTVTADDVAVTATDDGDLNESNVALLVHQGINERRAAHGLARLDHDAGLIEIADGYAETMAETGHYGHTGPDGSSMRDRYEAAGYECRAETDDGYATGAENIQYTYYQTRVEVSNGSVVQYDTEQALAHALVRAWMRSPGHRENILQPFWDDQGIGIGVRETGGDTQIFAVQNFC
jgi:uncharacterized protein YkwD